MNTRKDNNGKAMAAWLKLGPGHIAKPLRFILRLGEYHFSARVKNYYEIRRAKKAALLAASRSNGLRVQQIARSL